MPSLSKSGAMGIQNSLQNSLQNRMLSRIFSLVYPPKIQIGGDFRAFTFWTSTFCVFTPDVAPRPDVQMVIKEN